MLLNHHVVNRRETVDPSDALRQHIANFSFLLRSLFFISILCLHLDCGLRMDLGKLIYSLFTGLRVVYTVKMSIGFTVK